MTETTETSRPTAVDPDVDRLPETAQPDDAPDGGRMAEADHDAVAAQAARASRWADADKTAAVAAGEPNAVSARPAGLFDDASASGFRERWVAIQAAFVDEPRASVEQADALVREVMDRLARSFAEERSQLESHWSGGGDASTEDLRVAIRKYRSFFDRLLSL
jgi:hypothetical protein